MEGGTISVNCTYNPWQQRWREKSWCKQIDETKCQHVVSARRFWLPFLKNRNGTTSIRDNVREGVLTVTMKRLKKQDAGLYQCKTDYLGETNSLRKVQVEVLTGTSQGSEFQEFLSSYLHFMCDCRCQGLSLVDIYFCLTLRRYSVSLPLFSSSFTAT